jgi:hypothetical protein
MPARERLGAGTGIEAVNRRGRRQRRRNLATGLRVLGAACILAVTACASASGQAIGKQADSVVGTGLRQRIDAAQDPVGYLVRTTATQEGTGSSSTTTVWTDPVTGNAMLRRGSGASQVANWERDYYENRVLHWDQTQVNYGPRTWWTADEHAAAPIKGPVPAGPAGGGYTPAAVVTEVLDKAAGQIVGYPVVDGRRTIELSVSMTGSRFDFWVDSRTYQVIRTVKYFLGAMPFPPIRSDYHWVRTSAAMVDLIDHPLIPAGFTQVRVGQSGP